MVGLIPHNPRPRPLPPARRSEVAKLKEFDLILDALPDSTDVRDRLFEPTLTEVPLRVDVGSFRKLGVPVLNQGSGGAGTAFGLATVAHCLLRTRSSRRDPTIVSPRWIYEMAKRYDDWEDEEYTGSSARAVMKGWHKHGLCSEQRWHFGSGMGDRLLTEERAASAAKRPLAGYYRVDPEDLMGMYCALAEVGVVFATAAIHMGWLSPDRAGRIHRDARILGGHAFAIVAYDGSGFWVQNSWGANWGLGGLALLTYDDWRTAAMDAWVGRLDEPGQLETAREPGSASIQAAPLAPPFQELRSHIITVADGNLRATGTFGITREGVRRILREAFASVTRGWRVKRLLIYAHGGLGSEREAVDWVGRTRTTFLEAGIYPLVFIWRTDLLADLSRVLEEAIKRRRPAGLIPKAKEFLLKRLDEALEPLARRLGGKVRWDDMKEEARLAMSAENRAGRVVLAEVAALAAAEPALEIHLAAHSAGSVFLAEFLRLMTAEGEIAEGPLRGRTGYGLEARSCTLWAPACTIELFKQTYLPAIRAGAIGSLAVYNLTDEAELRDDCAGLYSKSLLYLVAHALEGTPRLPEVQSRYSSWRGTPLLGIRRFVEADPELRSLFGIARPPGRSREEAGQAELVLAPNNGEREPLYASTSRHHGDFERDQATLQSTVARILRPSGEL